MAATMKLSLMMIVRDSEETLRACLESAVPYVDELVIGLGGVSTDGTEAIAREFVDLVGRGEVFQIEWEDDFAKARNEVLARITGDAALWLDSDDLLVGGDRLRKHAEDKPEVNCFYVGYEYGKGEQGETNCFLVRERVVRNPKQWTWLGRIHEVLTLEPDEPLVTYYAEDAMVVHQSNRKDKGTRNLDALYRELEESEPDPSQRTLMYLGNENASRGNFKEALMHWNRFISRAERNEEAYQVAHKIADVLRASGKLDEAEAADVRAVKIMPTWPDAYLGLAQTAYERRDWPSVVEWTKAGATKKPPLTGLIVNPLDYSYYPYYYLGLAYAQMGDVEMALENLNLAFKEKPDTQLLDTITALHTEGDRKNVLTAFMALYQHLGRHDEWLKARRLFELAPKLIETHPEVQEAWRKTALSTAHVDDPQVMVDFYRGNPGWAPMDDETILSEAWAEHPRMKFARKALCGPPKYILDMGSSDGFISLPLAKDGYTVTGYDLDPRCVALADKRAKEWDASALYWVGSVDDLSEYQKYDAALAFEIIEHLVDPGEFLDKLGQHAHKIVLTTPYLAWEGGRLKDWDKVEPKGHLRIFDLNDIEMLLAPRGRIVDLYREPWQNSAAWIFASYYPGQRPARQVTFLAPNTLEEWSPRKLAEEGLGGSETALIKLAESFAANHDTLCTTFGRIDNPGYYNGVRYRQADAFIPDVRQDAYIAWRWPEAADLPMKGRMILWMHDTDAGDRLTPARAYRFDKIVVLSEWHREHMLRTYPWLGASKLVVIGNGVDPERFTVGEVTREPLRVAYTSSPDRGLDVILEHIWPKVTEAVPDAELHVYYGWNNFEALKGAYPQLGAFQQKIAQLLLQNKNVVMHGRVTQEAIATELRKASVWLYPTYFSETYCISAVEAQLAGAIPVTNNLAALDETVKAGEVIHGDVHDPKVIEHYVEAVIGLLRGVHVGLRSLVIREAPRFSWSDAAALWNDLLVE